MAEEKNNVVHIDGPDGGTITFDKKDPTSYTAEELAAMQPSSASVPSVEVLAPVVVAPMGTSEKVFIGVVTTAMVGLLGAVGWFGYKEEQKRAAENKEQMEEAKRKREELAAWFEEQRKLGMVIIETADREYMSIPADAYAKSEVRKRNS